MRTSIVLLGLVAMAAVVSADMCLTRVNYLNEGDACDVSSAPCRHSTKLSLYCSSSGVCTKTVDAGASCTFNATVYNQSPCSDQLTCIAGTCVANAGPGMVCTSSLYNDTSMPFCARPFSCISNMCQFGSLGDACTNNTGCSSNMCSGGVCVGKPIGQNCTSDTECGLLSFCDRYTDPFNMTNWLCRAAIPTVRPGFVLVLVIRSSFGGFPSRGFLCAKSLCFSSPGRQLLVLFRAVLRSEQLLPRLEPDGSRQDLPGVLLARCRHDVLEQHGLHEQALLGWLLRCCPRRHLRRLHQR